MDCSSSDDDDADVAIIETQPTAVTATLCTRRVYCLTQTGVNAPASGQVTELWRCKSVMCVLDAATAIRIENIKSINQSINQLVINLLD